MRGMGPRARWVAAIAILAGWIGACEVYDAPPDVTLVLPVHGKWYHDTPLELVFSEPIAADTLHIDIWPHELDIEGDIMPGVEPVIAGCSLGDCTARDSGEELAFTLSTDGLEATLDHGAAFSQRQGVPHLLVVSAGLADRGGRARQVPKSFDFQINPEPCGGVVTLPIESGVIAMTADLTEIVPSVYLRLYFDIGVSEDSGETWLMGTVARLSGAYPPNTADPLHLEPIYDATGWTLFIKGWLCPLPDGELFLQTDPFDFAVKVSGAFYVQLDSLAFQATLRPGAGLDGRDEFTGFMHSSQGYFGISLEDMADLGPVGASWQGYSLAVDEVPEDLPRLCASDPCAIHDVSGADCQLDDPWVTGPSCP